MIADDLSADLWNAIERRIAQQNALSEVVFCRVKRRDTEKKLLWVAEFGEVPIPLVAHRFGFTYFDTKPTGVETKRGDLTGLGDNDQFVVNVVTPRVGQLVAILNPDGIGRFPFCIGVIHSTDYWEK